MSLRFVLSSACFLFCFFSFSLSYIFANDTPPASFSSFRRYLSCFPYHRGSAFVARYQADNLPAHIVELAVSVDKNCHVREDSERGIAFLFRRLWDGSCTGVTGIVARESEIELIEYSEKDLTVSVPYFNYLLKEVAKSQDFNFDHHLKISLYKNEDGVCMTKNERLFTYKGRDYPVEVEELHASYEKSTTDEKINATLPLGIRIKGKRVDTGADFILWLGDHPGTYQVSFMRVREFSHVGVNTGLD